MRCRWYAGPLYDSNRATRLRCPSNPGQLTIQFHPKSRASRFDFHPLAYVDPDVTQCQATERLFADQFLRIGSSCLRSGR